MRRSRPEARPESRVCTAQYFQSNCGQTFPEVLEFAFRWVRQKKNASSPILADEKCRVKVHNSNICNYVNICFSKQQFFTAPRLVSQQPILFLVIWYSLLAVWTGLAGFSWNSEDFMGLRHFWKIKSSLCREKLWWRGERESLHQRKKEDSRDYVGSQGGEETLRGSVVYGASWGSPASPHLTPPPRHTTLYHATPPWPGKSGSRESITVFQVPPAFGLLLATVSFRFSQACQFSIVASPLLPQLREEKYATRRACFNELHVFGIQCCCLIAYFSTYSFQ